MRVPYADAVASRTVAGLGRLLASHGSGSGRGDAGKAPIPGPEQVDDAQPFALSVMSQAYWAGQHLDEGATPVVAHFYREFDGAALDPRRMERACRLLYERNPMLRAVVTADGAQYVRPLPDDWALPVDDLRDLDETGLAAKLLEIREERAQRNMRPDRGEVFQVGLALLPEERSRTFVKLYMGVGDALSFKMALEQLAALYKDPDGPWDEPRMTYAQYVTAMAAGGDPARELDRQWWLERLDTIHGAPSLPLGDPGAPLHSRRLAHRFTADEWGALRGLAADLGVTPTVLLLTVFGEVIGAWSENRDLVINMPVFRREELHPDVMRIVGDFTGSLLVNLSTGGDGSLAEKVRVNATQVADALGHSHYSGVEVLRDLNRSSAERRTAPIVFTSAIGVGELFGPDFMEVFGPPGWVVSQGPTVLVDCQVSVLGGCLCVNWDVREHVIDDSAVDAMFTTFTTWLASIARDGASSGAPGVPEGQLSVRCDRAMASNRVVEDSGPLFVGGGGCCLHGRFFEVAGADPGRVAVIDARGEHGFGEVARRALAVAAVLREGGLRPGDRVLVSCPRGVGQVVAVLGVLAAGGCYVPVDVGHPRARRERIAGICGARVVVDESWLARVPVLEDPFGVEVSSDPSLDAYVVFTSGTTGEPKGVVMTHAGAMNTIADVVARWGVGADDRALMVSSLGFDLSVFDLFGVLGRGGSLVVPPDGRYADPVVWSELVARYGVSVWNSAPAQVSMVLEAAPAGRLSSLCLVLVSGDWVPVDLGVRLWVHNPVMRVVALGGATEAGVWSNFHVVRAGDEAGSSIPYGVALSGQCMDVVDGSWRARPDLVAGDIVISGGSLARCYESDPGLTASRFVVVEGVRWYRTGDRGRWLPSGEIEFLGRTDTQVKIHGHRIELTEIEHAISTHPDVMGVAVVASEGRARQMYAAVVARPGVRLGIDELVGWQAQQIPWPCTLLSFVDELPLNRNGKVDRRAVLVRLMAEHSDGGATAGRPLGPLEAAVAAYWREYLSVPVRSADDDFFLLGGDSLIASRVIAAMRREGWTTSLADVFTHPGLGDYARTCVPPQGIREDRAFALVHDADHACEPFGLTEVQRAYLVGRDPDLTLGGVDCIFYREYRVEEVDEQCLGRAVDTVVARHPMLRTVFEGTGQRTLDAVEPYHVVRSAGAEAERMRRELSVRTFDPGTWPLFDVRVLEFGGSPHVCVTTNSIVMDAASVLVFQREVDAAYAGRELEEPPEIDFRDYVVGYLENETLSGERRTAALAHWREHAPELPPSPALPLARSPEELGVPSTERRTIQIDAGQWKLLRERCRREAVTPSALVLTSFCEAMRAFSGQPAVSVAVTVFDRPEVHPQIDRVLGDFTSLVVVAYRASDDQDWASRVKAVSREMARDLENSSIGMGAIGRLSQEAGASSALPVVFTSPSCSPRRWASSKASAGPGASSANAPEERPSRPRSGSTIRSATTGGAVRASTGTMSPVSSPRVSSKAPWLIRRRFSTSPRSRAGTPARPRPSPSGSARPDAASNSRLCRSPVSCTRISSHWPERPLTNPRLSTPTGGSSPEAP